MTTNGGSLRDRRGAWMRGRGIELVLITVFLTVFGISGCAGDGAEGPIELSFGHVGAPASLFAPPSENRPPLRHPYPLPATSAAKAAKGRAACAARRFPDPGSCANSGSSSA